MPYISFPFDDRGLLENVHFTVKIPETYDEGDYVPGDYVKMRSDGWLYDDGDMVFFDEYGHKLRFHMGDIVDPLPGHLPIRPGDRVQAADFSRHHPNRFSYCIKAIVLQSPDVQPNPITPPNPHLPILVVDIESGQRLWQAPVDLMFIHSEKPDLQKY